jgi:ribosomal protein L37AE/L43A
MGIELMVAKIKLYQCKECREIELREKEAGLWECLACGRMTNKKPIPLPQDKIAGNWRRPKAKTK